MQENRVFDNAGLDPDGVGIYVCESSGDNTFNRNDAAGNPLDILDDTSGGGTAGTDNLYLDNTCDTSDPFGLCQGATSPPPIARQSAKVSRPASANSTISSLMRR